MEFRTLGRTGISLSAVGFGCGAIGGLFVRGTRDAQRRAVEAALEGGINYFDTAGRYGDGASEENLGKVLRDLGAPVHVGTKVHVTNGDLPEVGSVVRSRLEEGLRRLQLDRVEVLTLHSRLGPDPDALRAVDVTDRVVASMHEIVDAGLASAVGFTGLGRTEHILELARCGHFDTFQCYFNLLNPSAAEPGSPDGVAQDFGGVLGVADQSGLGVFCVRALAGGALSGRSEPHELARRPGSAMAQGEEFDDDLRRARSLGMQMRALPETGVPELALRYALGERRFSSVVVGFSDDADVRRVIAWEAAGPLPRPLLRTLHRIRPAHAPVNR